MRSRDRDLYSRNGRSTSPDRDRDRDRGRDRDRDRGRGRSRDRSRERSPEKDKDKAEAGAEKVSYRPTTLKEILSVNAGISMPEAIKRLNHYNKAAAAGLPLPSISDPVPDDALYALAPSLSTLAPYPPPLTVFPQHQVVPIQRPPQPAGMPGAPIDPVLAFSQASQAQALAVRTASLLATLPSAPDTVVGEGGHPTKIHRDL